MVSDRGAVWFIDNTVALSAMIKGSSAEPDLAGAAATIHLVLADRRSRVWFEYIESDSNSADEPSRALWASRSVARKPTYSFMHKVASSEISGIVGY